MGSRGPAVIFGVLVALLLAWRSLFQVSETQAAIRSQFGKILGADYSPGLHLKWPWDTIHRFERRIITKNYPRETFLTSENKALTVDFYVKWRVKDVAKYYTTTQGVETYAADRLGDTVKDGIKGVVARRTLQEIVVAERAAFTGDMISRANDIVQELGVELIDVRIQRLDLPDEVSGSVYQRMEQNFKALGNRLRGEGSAEMERIQAGADRERTELLARAQRDAQRLRGEGDALAGRIYAQAYGKNPEFYAFYRSLQAYRNSLVQDGDVWVVSPDSEFFKYLQQSGRR
jgi:modulator of FtsH protease HflC